MFSALDKGYHFRVKSFKNSNLSLSILFPFVFKHDYVQFFFSLFCSRENLECSINDLSLSLSVFFFYLFEHNFIY